MASDSPQGATIAEAKRAFPSNAVDPRYGGMDLRDYFAAKALERILYIAEFDGYNYPSIAQACYMAADAMMAEREKRGG